MQGAGAGQMSSSQGDKGLLQFLGQNSANVSSAAANAIMMQRLLGTGYELHPLGSRKDNDPMAHIKVARSSKGWHCPQCIHISSTKGNLKSHILSGRHKTYTEKPFGCQYCDRSYGTKQSLQVHISTNHRAERDAEYQALSKSLGMKTFPEAQFYMKQGNAGRNGSWGETDHSENYESVMSPAALQQLQHQLQQAQVSQGHSQMNHQGQQQAQQVAATLASLSSQPSLTIQPTKGPMGDLARGVELLGNRGTDREKENLPSCRLEASGQNNKQEPQYAAVERARRRTRSRSCPSTPWTPTTSWPLLPQTTTSAALPHHRNSPAKLPECLSVLLMIYGPVTCDVVYSRITHRSITIEI